MLWLALRFPDLPLDAVFGAAERQAPCALVEGPAQRLTIAHADGRAQAAGVRQGQTLAAARAWCPMLDARARDRAAERQLLEALAAWAYQFSDRVGLAGAAALSVEVGASLSLFGGWPALQRRLSDELRTLGVRHALAAAPVAAGAHVLALSEPGLVVLTQAQLVTALGAVPLERGGLEPAGVTALHGMGFRRLRELFRLPRAELARRVGTATLAHLDRIRGLAPEALAPYRPPDRFEQRLELEARIEDWPPLLFPLQRLVRALAAFLAARDGGVERFELRLEHDAHALTRLPVGLLTPQRDAAALFECARGRLQRSALPAPVRALALVAAELPPLRPCHRDLFEPKRGEGLGWDQLAERLRTRLGDAALRGLATVADHRPERAWRFTTAEPGAPPPPLPRPLWLLPRPLPLHVAPAEVLSGPERIESGWWDGADTRRDYYVIRTRSGQRAWAYVVPGASAGWMLHGWFA
jgi:protein ImuB